MIVFAADYPFLDVLWTMIIFFAWVVWIWMMVVILTDLFGRRDIGGWRKAIWCVFMIVVPFVGVLCYLIAQHDGMTRRQLERTQTVQQQFDDHVRAVAGANGGASGAVAQIERAEGLLARGTISSAEFDALKQKALAAH
ncbi:SHOCT domain-containing protein [Conexibacter sp. JD483]|uniref:SHOCT domain-containing protein n=1 Tax=unclassified Conexibacter TaxID=2627773 RepID=UPI00271671D8|nr:MULTISPECIES: SHOCT domain-containing protein [unclassified Conexibacter]MDO8185626.1 SHOCT domain-containing protein [Conexibacter sp. CPCC 205706]MDO8198799.1 SHOCT domain-containing protein [Conexibacter sp. CPCC 205762]MDR9367851.1 SHOCT domain-containing protein [Conexibacter sp. JD483]